MASLLAWLCAAASLLTRLSARDGPSSYSPFATFEPPSPPPYPLGPQYLNILIGGAIRGGVDVARVNIHDSQSFAGPSCWQCCALWRHPTWRDSLQDKNWRGETLRVRRPPPASTAHPETVVLETWGIFLGRDNLNHVQGSPWECRSNS